MKECIHGERHWVRCIASRLFSWQRLTDSCHVTCQLTVALLYITILKHLFK